jgi:hypothetical protein
LLLLPLLLFLLLLLLLLVALLLLKSLLDFIPLRPSISRVKKRGRLSALQHEN